MSPMAWLQMHAESRCRGRCLSIRRIISRAETGGGGGIEGAGKAAPLSSEPPPDPRQPPAVGETPASAHVICTRQSAAAPETSNAASAAQHPQRVLWQAGGVGVTLQPQELLSFLVSALPRMPAQSWARWECPAHRSPSVPPNGRGCPALQQEAWPEVGAGV